MKKIKLITLILIVVLISLISFGGLYLKTDYKFENVLPEYKLGRNLSASRVIELVPNEEVNTVIKDAEGNIVEEAGENTVTEEVPVNSLEILTKDNFEKTKKIVIARLEQIGVADYNIRLDEETGKIVLELENNEVTDMVSSYISQKGTFTIVDEETEEVLIDSSYIKSSGVLSGSDQTGTTYGTQIYLNIEFDKEGAKKLEEISSKYVQTSDEEGNDTTKKVSLQVDGETLATTYFGEKLTTGNIQLSVGSSTTDTEELQEYVESCSYMAMLLNNEELPITYKTESDQYVSSNISLENIMPDAIYVLIGIIVAIFIVMVIRYKGLGVLGTISIIGYTAILLIVLRYTNVLITIEGIVGIVLAIILDLLLVKMLLKDMKKEKNVKEVIKENYIKYFVYIIPAIIMAIVFSFINVSGIASLGMTMFWGLVLIALYNIFFTRTMFTIAKK
ncbi:MAG: hypothetical protein IKT41_05755 [Clostridia bacterium]|nr:hypothetical protein [Clostridia bacterium]